MKTFKQIRENLDNKKTSITLNQIIELKEGDTLDFESKLSLLEDEINQIIKDYITEDLRYSYDDLIINDQIEFSDVLEKLKYSDECFENVENLNFLLAIHLTGNIIEMDYIYYLLRKEQEKGVNRANQCLYDINNIIDELGEFLVDEYEEMYISEDLIENFDPEFYYDDFTIDLDKPLSAFSILDLVNEIKPLPFFSEIKKEEV